MSKCAICGTEIIDKMASSSSWLDDVGPVCSEECYDLGVVAAWFVVWRKKNTKLEVVVKAAMALRDFEKKAKREQIAVQEEFKETRNLKQVLDAALAEMEQK